MLAMQAYGGPFMLPAPDIEEAPPIRVRREPVPGIPIQSIPVFIVERKTNNSRQENEWPVADEQREDFVEKHCRC